MRDRDERLYQLRKRAELERKIKQDEARGGATSEIATGIGSVVGGVIGGYYGGSGGAAGGAAGGGAAGGVIGSAL